MTSRIHHQPKQHQHKRRKIDSEHTAESRSEYADSERRDAIVSPHDLQSMSLSLIPCTTFGLNNPGQQ